MFFRYHEKIVSFYKKEVTFLADINNLFLLMAEKKISASKLSHDTGISNGNISDWKSGRSIPNGVTLIKLADYFDCSVDYLLGRTDNPDSHK